MNSQLRSVAVCVLLLVAAFPCRSWWASYYVQFASKAMLMAILALSLSLVVGYGGLVSMCHAAFFGLAGYMLGFMSPEDAGATLWWSLPAAMVAVGACGGRHRGPVPAHPRHLLHHGDARLRRDALLPLPRHQDSGVDPTVSTSTTRPNSSSAEPAFSISETRGPSTMSRSDSSSRRSCWCGPSFPRRSAAPSRRRGTTSSAHARSAFRSSGSG